MNRLPFNYPLPEEYYSITFPQSGSPTSSATSHQNGYSNTGALKSQTTSLCPSYNASNGPTSGPQNEGVQSSG